MRIDVLVRGEQVGPIGTDVSGFRKSRSPSHWISD